MCERCLYTSNANGVFQIGHNIEAVKFGAEIAKLFIRHLLNIYHNYYDMANETEFIPDAIMEFLHIYQGNSIQLMPFSSRSIKCDCVNLIYK